jgi:serine/threonine protein kinase/formylglycine-generating enzyme required for sulfatase activity
MGRMTRAPRPTDDEREALYDAYLAALAEGDVHERDAFLPDAFLRDRGVTDPELAERLAALRTAYASRRADGSIGRTIGGFRIEQQLGSGGMGVVYEATELALDRRVALKLLRADVAETPSARARFEREARAIARLRHPGIVAVHAIGESDGVRFLAMELVRGRSLDALLDEARAEGRFLPTTAIVRMGAELADALAAAHAAGIVHRDIKASNVLVADEGRAVLVDFGIARDRTAQAATLTEGFVGSPYAMAPERIGRRGEGAITDDPRSDIYGLGVVLYEALTGGPPFREESLEGLFQAILTEEPPSLRVRRPDLARDLETVVARAMAKDPARRYQSAGELREDLAALLEFRPIRARPLTLRERAIRWMRRRPALAAAIAVGTLSATTLAAAMLIQRATHERERSTQASAAIEEARTMLALDATEREPRDSAELRFEDLSRQRIARYLSDEDDRDLERLEREVVLARRAASERLDRGLELVTAAERLGASTADVRAIRAELYLARHDAARRARDEAATKLYARLAAESDDTGRLAAALTAPASIIVTLHPADAEVWLYRIVDGAELSPPREPRLLALPTGGATTAVAPDAWALEVTAATGPLARGDHILAIDGQEVRELANSFDEAAVIELLAKGAEASVLRGPSIEHIAIAPGSIHSSALRITARIFPRVPSAHLDPPAPNDNSRRAAALAPGTYLLLARAADGAECRHALALTPGERAPVELHLPPMSDWPTEGVLLPGTGEPRWILRREVTVAEWRAFVNDPATLEAIRSGGGFLRVPRSQTEGVHWIKRPDGRFEPPADWSDSWPVLGISYEDAAAFVAWRNANAEREGTPWRVSIPTYDEWMSATGGPAVGRWIFGDRWRPKWTSSVFANPKPTPMPVESFPIDESVLGVRDLAGSVSEFVDSWWREDVRHRRRVGGSWAFGDPNAFEIHFGNGLLETAPADVVGLRLVFRRVEAQP